MMELTNDRVKISRTASNIISLASSLQLTAESNNNNVTVGSISGNTITLNGGASVGSSTITVSYGSYTATCLASVVIPPTNLSVADANITFSTAYGKIDVIWLSGTGNTISSTPNAPNLCGMTPVTWTKNGDTWTEDSPEVTATKAKYNYIAGTGNADNTSSMWANAKNTTSGGNSYFVWIPRYAYRITYYSSRTSTDPTGFYDGWGQWRATDGRVRLALDSGIETVEHNGNKYIVHPAFCGTSVGYDNGSWSSAISGFWVAKYEMSRTGATSSSAGSGYNTTFLSVPSVQSARSITIGNMYNVAKSYDTSKESHLIKNSEWGAVAYLTQSQYGRNGNEIDINSSSLYTTGNGGGTTGVDGHQGTSYSYYKYNTTIGAKASTTGNIYGVYDMSGGACEYVAAFNNTDTNSNVSSYGWNGLTTESASDKYATKYLNTTSNYYGNSIIYSYGKIGDATKEVNGGGAYSINSTTNCVKWFKDANSLCSAGYPFCIRSGICYSGVGAGVFFSNCDKGDQKSENGFRVVLCP